MTTMFSAATAEPMRAFPPHERHPSDHLHSYAVPPRPTVELPRPLEPRPTHQLHPSLSDASRASRRTDGFRNPAPAQPEHRPQTQNLPRLHDILTSAPPPAPSPSAYSSGWSATAGPPPQPNGDSYHSHTGWHPPLAHPPHESAQPYHPQPGRRLELPILETNPVARHDSHVVPHSPYSGYPDHPRDYNAPRRDQARRPSITSYHHNGAPSPYTPAGPDEMHYRGLMSSLDRGSNYPPAGPDSSKKYMGVREIPGEGTYHFYEGGYRIPTHVDGETVNPAWGLTKANKPRKRLAMACLDCREKKIKCEPGANSCLQCEKAKRPCRKAPIQPSQPEPNAAPVWQASATSPLRRSAGDVSQGNGYDAESDLANKRRTMEDAPPSDIPSKKHRSTSPRSSTAGPVVNGDGPHNHTSPAMPISPGKIVSWDEDLYAIEPEMTRHILEAYFVHVNSALHAMFPRQHFMWWLTAHPQKSQNERLVLYSMIAMGSVFADDRYSGFGKHCANIVTEAVLGRPGQLSMAIVQARLLLGSYHFARGANNTACDYFGAGVNAATFLRYYTEQGCCEEEDSTTEKSGNEFAFSNNQLAECKRRTMWSVFLMDRYVGATRTLVNVKDIFIRLPCTEEVYERGLKSNAPCHNNGIMDAERCILTANSEISTMGWLISLAAIWGDVSDFVYRAVHFSSKVYEAEYERFFENTRTSLLDWQSRLPDHLQYSQTNIERSIQGGYEGQYISMHVLYHLSWLKLSRFAKHACIPKSIARNVRACHRHAHELLQVVSALRAPKWETSENNAHPSSFFSHVTLFTGYGILAAIDVVGAGGLDSSLNRTLDLISCGLECLRELGRFWNSARDQDKACEKRYYQIHNVLKYPFTARSGCWLGREWGVHSSLEREFAPEDDCIYGVSDRDYFDALKDDPRTSRAGA